MLLKYTIIHSGSPLWPRLSANMHVVQKHVSLSPSALMDSLCARAAEQGLFLRMTTRVGGEGPGEVQINFSS